MSLFSNIKDSFARWRKPESHRPAQSFEVDYRAVSDGTQLEREDCISWFTADMIRRCWADSLEGGWAEQQWLWEQLTRSNARLLAMTQNREASLAEYGLYVDVLPDLNAADQALAEAQSKTLSDFIASIANLPEAIRELGAASLRHYTILQPIYRDGQLYLESVPRWLVCRDGYTGAWRFNPNAQTGVVQGEDFPFDLDMCVMRVCPAPLLLAAQNLILDTKVALQQWAALMRTYGSPPLFLVMPDGISNDDKTAYITAAANCVSNAKGVLPFGSDLKSAAVPATSVDLFNARISLANEELTLLLRGSTLTSEAAPGSGTLAGNAHADTTDRIAAGEAREIAALLTRTLAKSVIAQYHGTQPMLCRLAMRRDTSPSVTEEIANLASLRTAGYAADIDQARERTGWDLTPAEPTPAATMMTNTELKHHLHANRSGISYEPARIIYTEGINRCMQLNTDYEAQGQMEVLQREAEQLLNEINYHGLDNATIARDAAIAENALKAALNLPNEQIDEEE